MEVLLASGLLLDNVVGTAEVSELCQRQELCGKMSRLRAMGLLVGAMTDASSEFGAWGYSADY